MVRYIWGLTQLFVFMMRMAGDVVMGYSARIIVSFGFILFIFIFIFIFQFDFVYFVYVVQ